jgi:hypothetical protein
MRGLQLSQEEIYLPLLMAIEVEIKKAYGSNPRMRDIDALRAVQEAKRLLKRGKIKTSNLTGSIVMSLQQVTQTNDYSPEEAEMCLSHIATSIRRHRRVDGSRGYLDFISGYVP